MQLNSNLCVGSTPPDSILKTFLEMAEKVEGGIAGQFSAHSLNFFYYRTGIYLSVPYPVPVSSLVPGTGTRVRYGYFRELHV